MTRMSALFLSVLACLPCYFVVHAVDVSALLTRLADDVANQQITSGKNTGIYEVNVFIHVPPEMTSKYASSGHDDTIFVTLWTVALLLEASMYSGIPFVTPQQLNSAMTVIEKAEDRNTAGDTSLLAFYVQKYNATSNRWQCYGPIDEENTTHSLMYIPENEIRQHLLDQGVENADIFAKVMATELRTDIYLDNPIDFDGTTVYLGIGALLAETQHLFPTSYAQWMDANPNPRSVTNAMKSFAYRPFDTNNPNNSTDPKSYYVVRHFIQEAASKHEDVAILPTWLFDQADTEELYREGKTVQFTMNDLDLVVCVQGIYGITSAILFDILPPETLNDSDLQKIYLNTTSYVVYEIRNNFSGRADLVFNYYRSINEFYWFTSRILSLLERVQLHRELPHPSMSVVYNTMKDVLRGQVTQELLDKAKPTLMSEEIYFDSIPGDVAEDNDVVQDRVANTAITTLALLNTWSIYNVNNKTTSWIKGTPVVVQQTIAATCTWLAKHIEGDEYKRRNTFFSALIAPLDMSYWYPTNRLEFLNGTKFSDDCDLPEELFIGIVEGLIPEVEYQAMLNQNHFGVKTPTEFSSLEESFYKFWSSEAITYATTLLALSQYDAIIQNS